MQKPTAPQSRAVRQGWTAPTVSRIALSSAENGFDKTKTDVGLTYS